MQRLDHDVGDYALEVVERIGTEELWRRKIPLRIGHIGWAGQPYGKRIGQVAVQPGVSGMFRGLFEEPQAQTEAPLILFVVDGKPDPLRAGDVLIPR
jgi:hypothetical protein